MCLKLNVAKGLKFHNVFVSSFWYSSVFYTDIIRYVLEYYYMWIYRDSMTCQSDVCVNDSIYNDLVAMAPALVQPTTDDADTPGSD